MSIKIVNSSFGKSFEEKELNGRPHLVVPVTMIVPGVLNGSGGPGFYSASENKLSVPRWNNVPLVIPDHPTVNEKHVTARDPDILNKYQVGVVLNAFEDEGSLKAFAWIDVKRAEKIEPMLLLNVRSGKQVEVSTGLGMKVSNAKGDFNSKEYDWVASDYQPDHLAILMNSKGACSIEDGCGLMVNQLSSSDIRAILSSKLQQEFGDNVYLEEDYTNKIIYFQDGQLFSLKFTRSKSDVSFVGDPVKVARTVSYKVVNETGDQPPTPEEKEIEMNKAELVNSIVNSGCDCWGEDDREILNGFSETKLQKIANSEIESTKHRKVFDILSNGMKDDNVAIGLNEGGDGITYKIANTKQEITLEDLPEDIVNAVNFGKKKQQEEKDALIDSLLANKSDDEKKTLRPTLEAKTMEDLQFAANFASAPSPAGNETAGKGNFSGRRSGEFKTNNSSSEFDSSDELVVANFSFGE